MHLLKGTYEIGPEHGTVTLRTGRDGFGAVVGHDLVLEATRWHGELILDPNNPSASRVEMTVDARSLEVVAGVGGVKPLTSGDRAEIAKNINGKILHTAKYPKMTFHSTGVSASAAANRYRVEGDLTIAGRANPVTLDLVVMDSGGEAVATATATIVQTAFGIKPFSTFLGALKVRDEVELEVTLSLPTS